MDRSRRSPALHRPKKHVGFFLHESPATSYGRFSLPPQFQEHLHQYPVHIEILLDYTEGTVQDEHGNAKPKINDLTCPNIKNAAGKGFLGANHTDM